MSAFRSSFLEIVRQERNLLRRFPRLHFAALIALFVPALYTLIYLSSVWDPNAKMAALPVGIVNQDAGIRYGERMVNVGDELMASLLAKPAFGYRRFDEPEAARRLVRQGALAFALIVPRDFSEHAMPGAQPGAAKLIIYASEGNDYTAAGMARHFAPEVAHQLNEALNEKRWELVLGTEPGQPSGLGRLKEAVSQLRAGAAELHVGVAAAGQGANELAQGAALALEASERLEAGTRAVSGNVAQLAGGMKQVGAGIQSMAARRASDAELKALRDGAREVAGAQAELGKGLDQLHAGALRLSDGLGVLKEETGGILLVGDKLAEASGELQSGAAQLAGGLDKARTASGQLASGAARLDEGVTRLTDGVAKLGSGLHLLASKLPEDAKLDALIAGARQLSQGMAEFDGNMPRLQTGAAELAGGLERLGQGTARLSSGLLAVEASLPARGELEGTASGLANSVEPALEIVAPVANNGTGFAPSFVTVALWVGAVMTAFLFHLHRVPALPHSAPRYSCVLGKLAIPGAMVLAQAAVMFVALVFVLDVHVPDMFTFLLTLGTSSLAFLAVVMALVRLLGDLGKFAAIFLLIVQLSAAGSLVPIELTGSFFQLLHPFLPFTWVIRAFRASMFGAFDNGWLVAWLIVVGIGAAALAVAAYVGKWKFVREEDYWPALDI